MNSSSVGDFGSTLLIFVRKNDIISKRRDYVSFRMQFQAVSKDKYVITRGWGVGVSPGGAGL